MQTRQIWKLKCLSTQSKQTVLRLTNDAELKNSQPLLLSRNTNIVSQNHFKVDRRIKKKKKKHVHLAKQSESWVKAAELFSFMVLYTHRLLPDTVFSKLKGTLKGFNYFSKNTSLTNILECLIYELFLVVLTDVKVI